MSIHHRRANHHEEPEPNFDAATGLHYGVIHIDQLGDWAFETIFEKGEDLTYARAVDEQKERIRHFALDPEHDFRASFEEYLGEHLSMDEDECADTSLATWDVIEDVREQLDRVELIWSQVEDKFADQYQTDRTKYRYERDGYELEYDTGDGDVFVVKSPYWTTCAWCSPSAPNAGYLTTGGIVEAYCLGPDWFEDGAELPYEVRNVADRK